MSKCKLHKLLHIFPRRTENCFQIDANICGERKILQIAKRKLVWNSIFSRWFIGFIILFANFTEIWQSYFEIKNNFMLIKSEWKSRIKCCRNFRFFFAAFAMKSRHIYLALINKKKYISGLILIILIFLFNWRRIKKKWKFFLNICWFKKALVI